MCNPSQLSNSCIQIAEMSVLFEFGGLEGIDLGNIRDIVSIMYALAIRAGGLSLYMMWGSVLPHALDL